MSHVQIDVAGAATVLQDLGKAAGQLGSARVRHVLSPVRQPAGVELAAEGGRLPGCIPGPLNSKGPLGRGPVEAEIHHSASVE